MIEGGEKEREQKPAATVSRQSIGELFLMAGAVGLLFVVPGLVAYGFYGWLRYGQYAHITVYDIYGPSILPQSDWVGVQKAFHAWADSDIILTVVVVAVAAVVYGSRLQDGDR